MSFKGSFIQGWADVLALVVKAPRTADEIRGLNGMSKVTISRILHALRNEGLVRCEPAPRVEGAGAGRTADIWTWAP